MTQRVQGDQAAWKQHTPGGNGEVCCPPAIVPILNDLGALVPQVMPAPEGQQTQVVTFATNLDPNGVTVEFYQRPKEPANTAGPPTVDNVAIIPGTPIFPDAIVTDLTPPLGGAGDVWMMRISNACGCCAFDFMLIEVAAN